MPDPLPADDPADDEEEPPDGEAEGAAGVTAPAVPELVVDVDAEWPGRAWLR
jgi:hypothetical protein